MTVYGSGSDFVVSVHDVDDVGTDTFLDITEFPPLDDEEEHGEGRVVFAGETPDDALTFGEAELGLSPDRWVNQGVVCDEYADFRRQAS